jgi:hypothetical protein
MWPFLNNVTTTCEQNYCTPASSICYTGSNLSCIGVNQNDTLSVALQKINAVMCEPIPSADIIEALGYTPANDANVLHTTGNETKNGTLIVNDTGEGVGVQGNSIDGTGVIGNTENGIGVEGNSVTNLAGRFDTFSGTKIVSFLTNSVEQAYILATGLFKANKILINTVVDNEIDALQVEGSANITADIRVNDLTVGKGNGNNPYNTAIGVYSLVNNTTGFDNTAIGLQALYNNTTGGKNIAIGLNSLSNNITGDQNIAIGHAASTLNDNDSNSIVIGAGNLGLGSNTTSIGNSATTTTGLYGNIRLVSGMATAPASATSPGILGDIRVTVGFIYVCIATNTWVRTELTTW